MAEIKSKYTDMQIKLMLAMLEELASERNLKCNWNNVAAKAGFKSGNSASVTWGNIRRGLQKSDGMTASAPPTPKTPHKRKTKGEDSDNDDPATSSSAKKAKTAGDIEGGNAKVKEEDH